MVGALTISFDAKQLQVCEKCFMEEKDSIKLASQLKLISPLIVGDINECELCYKKDENRKDKSSIFRPYMVHALKNKLHWIGLEKYIVLKVSLFAYILMINRIYCNWS